MGVIVFYDDTLLLYLFLCHALKEESVRFSMCNYFRWRVLSVGDSQGFGDDLFDDFC